MRGPGPRIVSILCLALAVCGGAGRTATARTQTAAASTAEPAQAPASPPAAAQAPATASTGGAQAPASSTAANPANGQSAPPATAAPATPPASSDQGTATPPTTAAPAPPSQSTTTPTPPTTAAPAAPSQGAAPPQGTSTPNGGSSKKTKGKTKDTGKPVKPVKPPPPPPKPPLPNKELLRLKPFTGSWACVGRTYGPGPEHPTAGTMTFTWQSDGFWLESRYDELRGVATNTVPVSSTALWVFDDLQAGVSSLSVDNIGGSATQLAPGWQGEKLIFEGPGHRFGTQFVDRDIYVLHGDGQFLHTQEANVNENWIKLHDDTCTRTTAK